MAIEKLREIQARQQQNGIHWEAADTTVSALGEAQQRRLGGLKERLPSDQEYKDRVAQFKRKRFRIEGTPPTKIDWRNNNGVNWTSRIKDQGACNACVAFATVATLESRLAIADGNAAAIRDLSEAHLFFCGCRNCCEAGWTTDQALEYCKQHGLVEDRQYPYSLSSTSCRESLAAGAPTYAKISGWETAEATLERKWLLASKGPVIGGLAVHEDFLYYRGGVYRKSYNAFRFMHAVAIVGYDDDQQCWIGKNSWGTGWGEKGWFRIGYGECLLDDFFVYFSPDLESPPAPADTGNTAAGAGGGQPTPQAAGPAVVIPANLQQKINAVRQDSLLRQYLRFSLCGEGSEPAGSLFLKRRWQQERSEIQQILQGLPESSKAAFCEALR